jgi:hypothetical protein
MKTNMLTRVRNLFPRSRHNQRAWIKSVRLLGEKWLLATPVNRRA